MREPTSVAKNLETCQFDNPQLQNVADKAKTFTDYYCTFDTHNM